MNFELCSTSLLPDYRTLHFLYRLWIVNGIRFEAWEFTIIIIRSIDIVITVSSFAIWFGVDCSSDDNLAISNNHWIELVGIEDRKKIRSHLLCICATVFLATKLSLVEHLKIGPTVRHRRWSIKESIDFRPIK